MFVKMKYDLKKMSDRIKYVRKEVLGLGQVTFAKSLGVKQQSVSRWEKGETSDPRHINKIASRHGINLKWLMEGSGDIKDVKHIDIPEWLAPFMPDFKDASPRFISFMTSQIEAYKKMEELDDKSD